MMSQTNHFASDDSESESSTLYDHPSVWSYRSDNPTLSSTPKPVSIPLAPTPSPAQYTYIGETRLSRYTPVILEWSLLTFVFLVCHAVYVIWLVFYVKIYIHPVPRNALNRTKSGYYAYQTFLYLIAIFLGSIDIALIARYGIWERRKGLNLMVYSILLGFSTCIFLIVIGAVLGGGWIIPIIIQSHEWSHGCDAYPMYAILTGGSPNTAYFYASGGRSLFTYTLSTADFPGVQQLTFDLSGWDVDQASIPADSYPTLQNITYNTGTGGVTGSCAIPSSSASQCVNGTFTKDAYLPINLTSSVPLTLSNTFSSPVPPMTSILGASPGEMLFASWTEAALILRQLDSAQNTSAEILRTAVHKVYHCRELKVCIDGVPGRGLVGAEVLVPLGLLFQQHTDYASWCYKRRISTGTGPDP